MLDHRPLFDGIVTVHCQNQNITSFQFHSLYTQLEQSKQKQTRLTKVCDFFYNINHKNSSAIAIPRFSTLFCKRYQRNHLTQALFFKVVYVPLL